MYKIPIKNIISGVEYSISEKDIVTEIYYCSECDYSTLAWPILEPEVISCSECGKGFLVSEDEKKVILLEKLVENECNI